MKAPKTSPKPKKNPFSSDPSKASSVAIKKRMANASSSSKGEGKMAEGTGARFMTNIEAPLKSKRPKKNPKLK